jgi:hypothetical protein
LIELSAMCARIPPSNRGCCDADRRSFSGRRKCLKFSVGVIQSRFIQSL